MAAPFRFSVIIPLEFHRGHVQACLRRWTREQTYAPERYEVVAAGCRSSLDAGSRRAVEGELRAQDRLLLFDEPHDVALCARAAAEARGDVLFFTESHCLPEADALERADDTLRDRPEWSGFSGRSIPITHNRLSVAEAEMYDADIRYGMPSFRGVLVELIEAAVELERMRFVRRWLTWARQSETTPASAGEWRPDTAHAFWSIGFHLPEQSDGRCFTWCQPLTMIELALVPGRYRLAIDWLTIKGSEDVRVYVNEKDVGISASDSGASGHFEVATDRPVRLALTSRRIHADGDSRLLGLPITAISWQRLTPYKEKAAGPAPRLV